MAGVVYVFVERLIWVGIRFWILGVRFWVLSLYSLHASRLTPYFQVLSKADGQLGQAFSGAVSGLD